MKRPRILFVSPRLPHPLNSGTKIRIGNLARALKEVGDMDFVGFCDERELDESLDRGSADEPWWGNFRSVQLLKEPRWFGTDPKGYRNAMHRHPFSKDALLYPSFMCDRFYNLVEPLATAADLIWVERLHIARLLSGFSKKMVVDLDDIESIKISRMATAETGMYTRWSMGREAKRLATAEKSAIRTFAGIAVCSEQDTNFFDAEADRAWVVPNGVSDDLMFAPPVPREAHHLVFVGTLNYSPNQDAVQHFCRRIFPRILSRLPNARLSIVGLDPPDSILALQDGKHVFVYANVPDVAPFVKRAALSIVPIRAGAGTRLKILESLALDTPVVSTRIGAEGLALTDGEHFLLADEADEFAAAVIRLLEDENLHARLCRQGRDRVRERYLWSSIRSELAQRCDDLLRATLNSSG
jgi:glycosyltransferase involved in cell wall biosynthesis